MDDEPDVLETVTEILDMCHAETARTFDEADKLLKTNRYDLVVLDIMGVKGLHLLDVAVERDIPAVMFTAPGFNPHYVLESLERGALSCFPKEDITQLDALLAEVLRVVSEGLHPWSFTVKRLEPLLDEQFLSDWKTRFNRLVTSCKTAEDDRELPPL